MSGEGTMSVKWSDRAYGTAWTQLLNLITNGDGNGRRKRAVEREGGRMERGVRVDVTGIATLPGLIFDVWSSSLH